MTHMRTNSTGFRFAGSLLLLALLPSFAPDTWGLSCAHHAAHEALGEHAPDEPPRETGHPPGASDHGSGGHPGEAGAPAHPTAASGHSADHYDPATNHHDPAAPPCTCAGQCSISAGPPSPVLARVSELPPAYPEPVRLSQHAAAAAKNRIPYLLPFANAPPLL